jgi:hypothetical protein
MVVTAVAFVDVDSAGFDPGQRLQFGNYRPQSVAVKGIVVQRLGMQHKLAASGLGGRGSLPTPCSRTHKVPRLYPCRCIRPS